MSLSERIAAGLFAVAARRWPPSARADLVREWTAEAYELAHEPGVGAVVRWWRRLRFAGSLACVRPRSVRAGRPGRIDAAERIVQRGLALIFAPVVLVILAFVGTGPLWIYVAATAGGPPPLVLVMFRVAQVAVGAVGGVVLAQRLPRAHWKQPAGAAGRVAAVAVMVTGAVVADTVVRSLSNSDVGSLPALVGAVGLGALLLPLTAAVTGLAGRSRLAAVGLAVVVGPLAVLAATWFVGWILGPRPTGELPGFLLVTAALALAYTLRLSWPLPVFVRAVPARSGVRAYAPLFGVVAVALAGCVIGMIPFGLLGTLPLWANAALTVVSLTITLGVLWRLGSPRPRGTPAQPRPEPTPEPAPVPVPRIRPTWWSGIALAGAVYSVLAWAVTLTYLTPNIGVQTPWPRVGAPAPAGWPGWNSEEGRVWMQDLRLYAIGCAALCLLVAAAYRGAPLLPVAAGAAILLAADVTVAHRHATRLDLLPWLAGGAVLLGAAVWQASIHLGRLSRRDTAARRNMVIRLTVMAAFLVPGVYFHRTAPHPGLPPVVALVAVGLPTVLAVLAALGVVATTANERIGARPVWQLPLAVGVGAALLGTLSFMDTGSQRDLVWPLNYLTFMLPPILAVPATALAIEAIRPAAPSARRRPAAWLGYGALTMMLGLVSAHLSVFASILSVVVLPWLRYGIGWDGIPYVMGAFLIAVVVAAIGAGLANRPRQPGVAASERTSRSPSGHEPNPILEPN